MDDAKIAEKLWDLANLVAGFGAAQSIATAFAISRGELKGFDGFRRHLFAAGGTVLFSVFYGAAIWFCWHFGLARDNSHADVWRWASLGRIGVVVLFMIVVLVAIRGHYRWQQRAVGVE